MPTHRLMSHGRLDFGRKAHQLVTYARSRSLGICTEYHTCSIFPPLPVRRCPLSLRERHQDRTLLRDRNLEARSIRKRSIMSYSKKSTAPNGDAAPNATSISALETAGSKLTLDVNEEQFATTNWAHPGKSEYNFFSDTATSGTLPMLQAIIKTTLQDDVFREDRTTNELEAWVAGMFGFEGGMLVTSGTAGNQLALRSHLRSPPHSVVADARSHLFADEAGGLATLSQAMCYGASPSGGREYLTLEDVQKRAVLDDALQSCPTKVVSLENTLGGVIMPLAECERISRWARGKGLIMHLDGARIWEVVAAQVAEGQHGGDLVAGLRAYAACFDSVQACFSKGLGAPIGSILMGSKAMLARARHHRVSIGGGMRATGLIAAPARVAVEQTFLGGRLVATHLLARRVAERWQRHGGRVMLPVDTNMVWVDLEASDVDVNRWMKLAEAEGITIADSRLVFHYQISEDAVKRLERVIDQVFDHKGA